MKPIIFSILFLFNGFSVSALDCSLEEGSPLSNYQGDCKRGKAHGEGRAETEDLVYEGEFKRGYPEGEGEIRFTDGRRFVGEFDNGEVYGEGIMYRKDGSTEKAGYWKGALSSFRYLGEEKEALKGYNIREFRELEPRMWTFKKTDEVGTELIINIRNQVARQVTGLQLLQNTSGYLVMQTNENGIATMTLKNVRFPSTYTVQYYTPSRGARDNRPHLLHFTLYEPGTWTVSILHN